MNWTGKHRAFTMETFIKTNKRTRSPDLNPCDFFLWGYLKSKVYSNRPQSIEELKDAIRQEIASIPHEMIRRVIDNFRERLQQCVDNNGSHLTDLIFKTK